MSTARTRAHSTRLALLPLILLALVASGLAATSISAAAAQRSKAGPGQYAPAEWFPLRSNLGGGEIKVGCTYLSTGTQGGYECADPAHPHGYHDWWALDLMAPVGTPVYAAGAGQVSYVRTGNTGCSTTSNSVQINHGNGTYSYYTHLDTVAVGMNGWVDSNTQLGTVGRTGLSGFGCASHLHYEKRNGTTQSAAVDPGPLKACHGSTAVSYPNHWGLSSWQGIPWGTRYAHSDGTGCGGGPAPQPYGKDLLTSGGFESGGWSFMANTNSANYSSGQLDPSELARSGSKYMAFNTGVEGGGMYQDVAQSIGVGDTYCASAFVRSQIGGTASGGFTVWMIGGAYNENGQQAYSRLGTRNNWSPVSTCVTATTAHSAIRVQFYATPNGGTTQVDDVNLSRSLVQGGGFESGGWSFMANTNSANYSSGQLDPSELARSGSKYMAFNTGVEGGGMYQDVAQSIGVGDTYCASAFVRSQIGGTASGGFTVWMIGGAYNGERAIRRKPVGDAETTGRR